MTIPPTPDHDRHLATVALTARLGEGDRPLSPGKFWKLHDATDGDPTAGADLGDDGVALLLGRRTAASLHLSDMEAQAITVLTPFHEDYPARYLQRLGTNAPPLLYAAGEVATAAQPERAVAIVGSRDANAAELDFAERIGKAAAAGAIQTVSGGAKGVDAAGLNSAWSAGGFVTAVLAEGVRRAIRKRGLRQILADEVGAVFSPVHPDAGFSVGAAMGRNKLVYALADLTVVAAVAEGGGGTWNGAVEALRRGYGRVAVFEQATAFDALRELGATPVSDEDSVLSLIHQPAVDIDVPEATPEQGSLF